MDKHQRRITSDGDVIMGGKNTPAEDQTRRLVKHTAENAAKQIKRKLPGAKVSVAIEHKGVARTGGDLATTQRVNERRTIEEASGAVISMAERFAEQNDVSHAEQWATMLDDLLDGLESKFRHMVVSGIPGENGSLVFHCATRMPLAMLFHAVLTATQTLADATRETKGTLDTEDFVVFLQETAKVLNPDMKLILAAQPNDGGRLMFSGNTTPEEEPEMWRQALEGRGKQVVAERDAFANPKNIN